MASSRIVMPAGAFLVGLLTVNGLPAWGHSESLELKDSKGNVRVKLGEVAEGSFGWQILDEKGRVVAGVAAAATGSVLTLNSEKASLRCSISDRESVVEMTQGAWRATLAQDASGELIGGYYTGDEANGVCAMNVGFKPGDSGGARLRLGNGKDTKESVFLSAERGGAGLQLSSGGEVRAQLATSGSNEMSYLLLGKKLSGLFLQALADSSALVELGGGTRARVTLQSDAKGSGLGVDRVDGSPAIRVGTKPSGEARVEAIPK